jgi:fatty acid desaturase
MSNLEGLLFEDVIDDKGLSYREYRKTLRPDYLLAWLYIGLGFIILFSLCWLSLYVQSAHTGWGFITVPCFAFLIGFWIAYLNLFIHEAGHFHLHPNKKTNDILANVFLCSWMGIEIKAYRKIHWQHHLHLATPNDTENSYYNPVSTGFIIETLTGIHLFRILTNKSTKQILSDNLKKKSAIMLLLGMIIHSTILLYAIYTNHWQFTITWVVGMLVFFPFFFTLRQILEHRDEFAFDKRNYYGIKRNKISRLFSDSLFSRLFGSAGFNKHMIHHWDPVIPFTALKDVEIFLTRCKQTKNIMSSTKTTYISVFKKLRLKNNA